MVKKIEGEEFYAFTRFQRPLRGKGRFGDAVCMYTCMDGWTDGYVPL